MRMAGTHPRMSSCWRAHWPMRMYWRQCVVGRDFADSLSEMGTMASTMFLFVSTVLPVRSPASRQRAQTKNEPGRVLRVSAIQEVCHAPLRNRRHRDDHRLAHHRLQIAALARRPLLVTTVTANGTHEERRRRSNEPSPSRGSFERRFHIGDVCSGRVPTGLRPHRH
jgi:hypothetical protein